MAQHTDEDDDRRDEGLRRDGEDFFQARVDVAGAVGNADAERGYDNHAERREPRVVRHHLCEQRYESGRAHHIGDLDRCTGRRMHIVKVHLREDCG